MTAPILAFYRDGAPDTEGRTLAEILAWPDAELEAVHDWVQWVFPLREPSRFNLRAPLLDDGTIAELRASDVVAENARAAMRRFSDFLGLRAGGSPMDRPAWLWPNNHNHLRITRAIRSLRMLGCDEAASVLRARVLNAAREFSDGVTAETISFWRAA